MAFVSLKHAASTRVRQWRREDRWVLWWEGPRSSMFVSGALAPLREATGNEV
jgi:hypothetical protein